MTAEDIFRDALGDFKKRLTQEEETRFQCTSLDDLRREIISIQRKQERVHEFRNMCRIESFLEAMEQFGKIIEVFLNTSEFLAFVWGPVKFLLQVASTWIESFDILLDAYGQIGAHIPQLEQYKALFGSDPQMRNILALIYSDILEFHRKAIRFFSRRAWRQLFHSVWKDFDARFKHILGQLRSHRELIGSQAALLHYQQYQQDRLMLDRQRKKEEQDKRREDYRKVVRWISGAQSVADHESFCSIKSDYKGTGDWIVRHEKVRNWKDEDTPVHSILWLNGIPGAGKTILASVIIESCIQNKSFTTGYFYCKDGDPERDNCTSVLKGLLNQLLCQHRDLVPYCCDKMYASHEDTLSSEIPARRLLEVFCQAIPKIYIIIDGLDECEEPQRKSILSFFVRVVDRCDRSEPGKLRVLVVSQDFDDIKKALPGVPIIPLKSSDNDKDIRLYVNDWVMKIQRKYDLEDRHMDYIKHLTCTRAQGMFLFARLVMTNLHDQPSREQLVREIEESVFPKGLGQAYERILNRIERNTSTQNWKITQRLLGWMVCARRPLKWNEVQGAVSLDLKTQTFEFDERKLRFHIRDVCGSLIQVLGGDRVELVHSTAKIYLVSIEGYVHRETVECNLTSLCLHYLTFDCFCPDVSNDELRQFALDGYFVFQDYALAKWSHHFCAMLDAGQRLVSEDSEDNDTHVALEELALAVDEFSECYEDEISAQIIVGPAEESCRPFKSYDFYEKLLLWRSHIYQHDKDFETRNSVSVKALDQGLSRSRQLLESVGLPGNSRQHFDSLYGERRYKCPKLTCYYFHEGFTDAKSRKAHVDRHNRPFCCPVPNCSSDEFGFVSKVDLEKHRRFYHPDIGDLENTFPSRRSVPTKTRWVCHLCGKSFTRNFHLTSHIRSHNGERPYVCEECGRAFTRANDCKRHGKIHERR